MSRRLRMGLGVVGLVLVGLAGTALAQVQTATQTETGKPLQVVEVERGEVVYVSGRNLMVKMEDGTIRHFTNVPEDARATVDGKEIGIRDLKPGMKLQRTITTTMTPQVITTVQTVTGKVFSVSPPKSVVLTLEDGTNQKFTIPEGQQFEVQGKTVDAFGLKRGMVVSATKIVQVPASAVAQQRAVTGTMPPPPSPPPQAPILIVQEEAPVQTASALPATLPTTGSALPLLGVAGVLSLGLGLLLGLVRRSL